MNHRENGELYRATIEVLSSFTPHSGWIVAGVGVYNRVRQGEVVAAARVARKPLRSPANEEP